MKKEPVEFYEVQRFRQWWVMAVLIAANGIFIYGGVQQLIFSKPFGNNPMNNTLLVFTAILFLALTVAILSSRLHTFINSEGIYVKFFPFQIRYKLYGWDVVQSAYIKKYNPMLKYGGWGIRFRVAGFRMKSEVVYKTAGNAGLQLILKNGKKVLIGTHRPNAISETLTLLGKKEE